MNEFKPSKNYLYRLSKEKIMELKEVFDAYDDDFDGVISLEHFGDALRAVGVLIHDADLSRLLVEVDPDKLGTITMPTFFVFAARKLRDNELYESICQSGFNKLYVDPRLLKKKDELDPTKEVYPSIPLSNLRSLLSTTTLGEPILDVDMDMILTSIEHEKLLDTAGNVIVEDLYNLMTTTLPEVVEEMRLDLEIEGDISYVM